MRNIETYPLAELLLRGAAKSVDGGWPHVIELLRGIGEQGWKVSDTDWFVPARSHVEDRWSEIVELCEEYGFDVVGRDNAGWSAHGDTCNTERDRRTAPA